MEERRAEPERVAAKERAADEERRAEADRALEERKMQLAHELSLKELEVKAKQLTCSNNKYPPVARGKCTSLEV